MYDERFLNGEYLNPKEYQFKCKNGQTVKIKAEDCEGVEENDFYDGIEDVTYTDTIKGVTVEIDGKLIDKFDCEMYIHTRYLPDDTLFELRAYDEGEDPCITNPHLKYQANALNGLDMYGACEEYGYWAGDLIDNASAQVHTCGASSKEYLPNDLPEIKTEHSDAEKIEQLLKNLGLYRNNVDNSKDYVYALIQSIYNDKLYFFITLYDYSNIMLVFKLRESCRDTADSIEGKYTWHVEGTSIVWGSTVLDFESSKKMKHIRQMLDVMGVNGYVYIQDGFSSNLDRSIRILEYKNGQVKFVGHLDNEFKDSYTCLQTRSYIRAWDKVIIHNEPGYYYFSGRATVYDNRNQRKFNIKYPVALVKRIKLKDKEYQLVEFNFTQYSFQAKEDIDKDDYYFNSTVLPMWTLYKGNYADVLSDDIEAHTCIDGFAPHIRILKDAQGRYILAAGYMGDGEDMLNLKHIKLYNLQGDCEKIADIDITGQQIPDIIQELSRYNIVGSADEVQYTVCGFASIDRTIGHYNKECQEFNTAGAYTMPARYLKDCLVVNGDVHKHIKEDILKQHIKWNSIIKPIVEQ